MVKMDSCTGATGGGQCSCRDEQNSDLEVVQNAAKNTVIGSSKLITCNGDIYAEKCNERHYFSIILSNLSLSANTYTDICTMSESKSVYKAAACVFTNAANNAIVGYGVIIYNSGKLQVISNVALNGGRLFTNFSV